MSFCVTFKDAKSVSWHPYNQSQILQYIKYTKEITIPKGCFVNNDFFTKLKTQQQQNKNICNILTCTDN